MDQIEKIEGMPLPYQAQQAIKTALMIVALLLLIGWLGGDDYTDQVVQERDALRTQLDAAQAELMVVRGASAGACDYAYPVTVAHQ